MKNELIKKLEDINNQIDSLNKLGTCDDCIHILQETKEWLESMICNYDY
jgi:hypothetical protein